jgi:hypothetical protein
VAHADTVFKKPPQRIFYDKQKNVMWSPEGLGADDRAGVFAIIQIIKSGLRPTVIITTDEEKGGIGASALVRNMPKPPTDLKYIIQLDRQGSMDCVFYDCLNKEFEEYVESFGFVTDFGSFSDISVLCPAWRVAGVNLSIGYYDEHSVSETLYIGHMNSTILKVKNMLRDAKRADSYIYIENPRKKWFRYSYPTEDEDNNIILTTNVPDEVEDIAILSAATPGGDTANIQMKPGKDTNGEYNDTIKYT